MSHVHIIATCWNIVEYSCNFCWSTTTHFEIADEEMFLSLCASNVVAVIMKRRQRRRKNRKIWTREWLRNSMAWQTIAWTSKDSLTRCSEFWCNLYQSFVSHVTIYVILRSYIVQARKSLVQIDHLTGVIKTPVELCCFQLFGRHVDISTKPCDTKLENDWLHPFNKRELAERNRAMLTVLTRL